MKGLLGIGKYLFAIPMAVFGIMHFMSAADMAAMAPFGGQFMIYLTGAALLAAAVSIIIGKMDRLATLLLGIMLLIFALSIHLPGVINAGEDAPQMAMSMSNLLKDIALAGGAFGYGLLAKDHAVIGD